MLADVLAACLTVARTTVVTGEEEAAWLAEAAGAAVAGDPGKGQGPAVASALKGRQQEAILIVNADLPCVVPHDLRSLLAATPISGIALVEALDGTTNALSLPAPEVFAPLFGPGSADRFRAHAQRSGLECVSVGLPNVCDDVDTLEDLERLQLRVGPRTQAALSELEQERVP